MEVFELKNNYEKAVNNYIAVFCEKYELQFDYWVADDIGTIAAISDYFIDFQNIKYCIDNSLDWEVFISWYNYVIEQKKAKFGLYKFNTELIEFKYKKGFGFSFDEFYSYLDSF